MGELEVRGPWVAAAYFQGSGAEKFTDDGWFQTGDVVKIDRAAAFASPTAPRTSSSQAANGSPPSTWRTC